MTIVYTHEFEKRFNRLPVSIQDGFDELEQYLREDPFHPYLHSKALSGDLQALFSFRVTRHWRVIFSFDRDKELITLHTIQSRQDAYRK